MAAKKSITPGNKPVKKTVGRGPASGKGALPRSAKQLRIHKTVLSFNDREMALIDNFCEKYHIRQRSKLYREAIIGSLLRQLEEDHPRLF